MVITKIAYKHVVQCIKKKVISMKLQTIIIIFLFSIFIFPTQNISAAAHSKDEPQLSSLYTAVFERNELLVKNLLKALLS